MIRLIKSQLKILSSNHYPTGWRDGLSLQYKFPRSCGEDSEILISSRNSDCNKIQWGNWSCSGGGIFTAPGTTAGELELASGAPGGTPPPCSCDAFQEARVCASFQWTRMDASRKRHSARWAKIFPSGNRLSFILHSRYACLSNFQYMYTCPRIIKWTIKMPEIVRRIQCCMIL